MVEGEHVALLVRIDEAWSNFWSRVYTLDARSLRQSLGEDPWPVFVALAHCGRWDDWHRDAIFEHLRDGSVRSYVGADEWNEEWATEDRLLEPEEARRRLADAHDQFRAVLTGLRPNQWDETIIRWVTTCTFEHYAEHAALLPS